MDSSVEDYIKREKLRALRNGVRRGKNNYEEDLRELTQDLRKASSGSKIADTLFVRLMQSLSKRSIVEDFEYWIGQIEDHI